MTRTSEKDTDRDELVALHGTRYCHVCGDAEIVARPGNAMCEECKEKVESTFEAARSNGDREAGSAADSEDDTPPWVDDEDTTEGEEVPPWEQESEDEELPWE